MREYKINNLKDNKKYKDYLLLRDTFYTNNNQESYCKFINFHDFR